jgi:hypothetical protein
MDCVIQRGVNFKNMSLLKKRKNFQIIYIGVGGPYIWYYDIGLDQPKIY